MRVGVRAHGIGALGHFGNLAWGHLGIGAMCNGGIRAFGTCGGIGFGHFCIVVFLH